MAMSKGLKYDSKARYKAISPGYRLSCMEHRNDDDNVSTLLIIKVQCFSGKSLNHDPNLINIQIDKIFVISILTNWK